MKKTTFFKMMLLAIVMMAASLSANAQLLVEDFSYTVGTLLTANGWTAHSGGGTNAITVTTPTLSYTGYKSSGVGSEVTLTTSGEDDNKSFTSQNSGSLYAAFLVNITSATTTGDYFAHFGATSGASVTTFGGRVFVKKDASGNLAFGIGKSSTAANINYTGFNYAVGTTYLIVVKYNFVTGATNDTADLFINPTPGGTEPSPIISTSTADNATADPTALTSICLRQGSASAAPALKLDGIRVATAWADAVAASSGPTPVATPTFSGTTGNVVSSQSVSITSTTTGASIYYTTDGTDPNNTGNGTLYTTPVTISTTTTLKAIAYYSGMTTSSIASAAFTFPTTIADIATLRAASTSGFYQLTSNPLLTFQDAVGKVKFIQDATTAGSGIVIYDGTPKITTTYAIGDKLPSLYCTLQMYNGMLELIPFSDPGAAVSSGNPVVPATATLANIATFVGQLVTVKAAIITGTGNFVASVTPSFTSYPINDGTAGVLRVAYTDLPYVGAAIPATNQDITGVVNMYSVTEADLIPRTADDFVKTTYTALNALSTTPDIYTSKGKVIFSAVAGQKVEIFSVVGQKLISTTSVEGLNAIPVVNQGVVMVKVGNRSAKVIL